MFKFKEWRRGDSLQLERIPGDWGSKLLFDEILFRVVPDAGTRLTQLLAGDVHWRCCYLYLMSRGPDGIRG
jgi:peptide/nickel transport system substrate-binding protein